MESAALSIYGQVLNACDVAAHIWTEEQGWARKLLPSHGQLALGRWRALPGAHKSGLLWGSGRCFGGVGKGLEALTQASIQTRE